MDKILKNENYTKKIVPISIFLTLELLFLLAFNLGDLGVAYRGFALLFAVALLPFFLKILKVDLSNGLIIVIFPLVIYLITMAFSPVFSYQPATPASTMATLSRDWFTLTMTILGSISFLLLGYFISRTTMIAKQNVMFLIFGGIGLLLLISLVATLFNYGFFHRIFYEGMVNYYDSRAYQITNQANLLQGFNIVTIDYKVLVTLGLLMITPIFALFFKKDITKDFYLYLLIAFAVVGVLTLVLLTDYRALIFLVPSLLLAVIMKFKLHQRKEFKITMIVLLSLAGLLIFLGILASFEVGFVVTFLKSNALTNRIYYNGYTIRYMGIIREAFDANFLFGNPYIDALGGGIIFPSGNLILDAIRETGIVGAIALIAFMVLAIKIAINYLNHGNDSNLTKYLILGFLLTLMSRYMINYAFNQLSFTDSYWSINYFPFVESKEFAISLFLVGYMFIAKAEKPVVATASEVKDHE